MAIKILLDTDIGTDVDDAVCLAYLLAQKECDLLGITTVTGGTVQRAQLASVLCNMAGRNIPIFPGTENPLEIPQKQKEVPQAKTLPKWPHSQHFPENKAIEFMKQVILENPDEVILLTIGPLTNIALLFRENPGIASKLKGLVMMAGAFIEKKDGKQPSEWNVVCDPHAADIVYNTKVPVHRSIGLDVTRKVTMDTGQVRERFNTGLLKPVYDFAQVWFEKRNIITFHDPLAAVTIFHDDVCTFQKGKVKVSLEDSDMGTTLFTPDSSNPAHDIAATVDPQKFFNHYFSMFK